MFYLCSDLFLHLPDSDRKAEIDNKINQRGCSEKDEYVLRGYRMTCEGVCGGHKFFYNKHQFRNADLGKIGSILNYRDTLACQSRDYLPEGLGKNDINHDLEKAESLASSGFYLAFSEWR